MSAGVEMSVTNRNPIYTQYEIEQTERLRELARQPFACATNARDERIDARWRLSWTSTVRNMCELYISRISISLQYFKAVPVLQSFLHFNISFQVYFKNQKIGDRCLSQMSVAMWLGLLITYLLQGKRFPIQAIFATPCS